MQAANKTQSDKIKELSDRIAGLRTSMENTWGKGLDTRDARDKALEKAMKEKAAVPRRSERIRKTKTQTFRDLRL